TGVPRAPALAVLAGLGAFVLLGPVPTLGVVVVVFAGRVRRRRRRAARAADDVVSGVAETADLLVAAVGAGLTPHGALARTAPVLPASVGSAVAHVLRRVEHGER